MLAGVYEPQRAPISSSTVHNDNHLKVRFWTRVGEKPEVELALV